MRTHSFTNVSCMRILWGLFIWEFILFIWEFILFIWEFILFIWEFILSRMSAACVYYGDYWVASWYLRISDLVWKWTQLIRVFSKVGCIVFLHRILNSELIFENFWLFAKVDDIYKKWTRSIELFSQVSFIVSLHRTLSLELIFENFWFGAKVDEMRQCTHDLVHVDLYRYSQESSVKSFHMVNFVGG